MEALMAAMAATSNKPAEEFRTWARAIIGVMDERGHFIVNRKLMREARIHTGTKGCWCGYCGFDQG